MAEAPLPSPREVIRMLRTERMPWPRHVNVRESVPPARGTDDEIVITFIGHSTFLIQTADGNMLTDPVYSSHAGPFGIAGPRRSRAPGVALADIPEISVVLLSHNHYDHCDLRTLRRIQRKFAPLFVTPLGNARLLRRAGAKKVEELDWWQEAKGAPMDITLTPAQHFSARTPFDRNRALWGGFVVTVRGRRIFFTGDSGYGRHFRMIRERLGAMDVSLLPIGAYEPRWFMKPIHMNPAEAVRAHGDLDSRQSIACHFGTFQLTLEGIDEPVAGLSTALSDSGIAPESFRALEVGESVVNTRILE